MFLVVFSNFVSAHQSTQYYHQSLEIQVDLLASEIQDDPFAQIW